MKDLNDMATEREMIEAAQDAIGDLKKALRGIQKQNEEDGRLGAANAAMGFRGDVIRLHSNMTSALAEFYPDFSDEIQVRGGGGRGG